jgi:hypothetical protein
MKVERTKNYEALAHAQLITISLVQTQGARLCLQVQVEESRLMPHASLSDN